MLYVRFGKVLRETCDKAQNQRLAYKLDGYFQNQWIMKMSYDIFEIWGKMLRQLKTQGAFEKHFHRLCSQVVLRKPGSIPNLIPSDFSFPFHMDPRKFVMFF